MTVIFTPADPKLAPMFSLGVHDSLLNGLVTAAALRSTTEVTTGDANRLDSWADTCENPSGQRAAFARALANLARTGNGLVVTKSDGPPVTFWDAASR